jgi:2-polyprenyl-3-methyl-5-hydroxy-6-metoxy-1,4-benzoquinol methylase
VTGFAATYLPATWSLDSFAALDAMRPLYQAGAKPITRYSLKHLRYWFVRHLLERHAARLGRPLRVLEVGVDRGQMLAFMGGPERSPATVAQWDAIDVIPSDEMLRRVGYDSWRAADVDTVADPQLATRYDAMIFLHLLEHLRAPEACLAAFARHLPRDGVMIGGSPTMPRIVADAGYERRLARRARPYGHVSVISPERVESFAEGAGLRVAFMSGAFLMRKQGSALENSRAWLRFNLAFGGLFPSLGSELYFALEHRG